MAQAVPFLGLDFDPLTQDEVLEVIERLSVAPRFSYVVTPNVDHLVQIHAPGTEEAVPDAFRRADLRVCDSRVLQLLARRSGLDLPLVTGSDLTAHLVERMQRTAGQVAVIGGDQALLAGLKRRYPAVRWEQFEPPMGVRRNPDAQAAIARFVAHSEARIFLFAIGAPQSEIVCARIAELGEAHGVALCIGASLEFLTGAKRRAPRVLQRLKLEWLFRLLSEPGRLWRRYLVEGPRIFLIWRRWRLSAARQGAGSGSSRFDGV